MKNVIDYEAELWIRFEEVNDSALDWPFDRIRGEVRRFTGVEWEEFRLEVIPGEEPIFRTRPSAQFVRRLATVFRA